MPIFYTGTPIIQKKKENFVEDLTVLNITAKQGKIVYVYYIAMFIIPFAVLYGIRQY
jgi:hypothetical protein